MTKNTTLNSTFKVTFIEINAWHIHVHLVDGSEKKLIKQNYDIDKIYKYFSDNKNKINNEYFVINFDSFLIKKENISFFEKIIIKPFYKLKSIFTENTYEENINEKTVIGIFDNIEIPNADKLISQINHAKKIGNDKGIKLFLKRLTKIIDKRGHSVNDLMTFIEKADLPITSDGYVLAYKSVKRDPEKGGFVDVHSGKILQKYGDFVYMDENSVDNNRRVSCSNGLHIASRSYLRCFSGDTILIVKVAPENFIAVPIGEPTKVRVSGYHIVGILTEAGRKVILSESLEELPFEDCVLINNIIKGNHVNILNKVYISDEKTKALEIKKTNSKPKKLKTNIKVNNKEVLVKLNSEKDTSKDFEKEKNKIINELKHEKNIIDDRKNGMSIKALAKKYKHSDRTINKILSKHS